jgi:hypothetical protein
MDSVVVSQDFAAVPAALRRASARWFSGASREPMSNDVGSHSFWWGLELCDINNASRARNTLRYASTRCNYGSNHSQAVAAAHDTLVDRVPAPVVCGACPLRLQVHCCLYLRVACPQSGLTCLRATLCRQPRLEQTAWSLEHRYDYDCARP